MTAKPTCPTCGSDDPPERGQIDISVNDGRIPADYITTQCPDAFHRLATADVALDLLREFGHVRGCLCTPAGYGVNVANGAVIDSRCFQQSPAKETKGREQLGTSGYLQVIPDEPRCPACRYPAHIRGTFMVRKKKPWSCRNQFHQTAEPPAKAGGEG
jgi:hypothetical protein